MKPTFALTAAFFFFATFAAASPAPVNEVNEPVQNEVRDHLNILEARKSCGKDRSRSDKCGGRRLSKRNSFHNCKNSGGKCCAKNSNGSGGIDVKGNLGREDCGYCYSGKCSG